MGILPKNIHFIASFLTMFLLVYVTEMFDTLFIGLLMAKIKKPTRLQTQLRCSSNAVINDGYSTTKYVAKSVINSSLKFQSKYERHQHSDFNFESGTIHDVGSYAKSAINNQFKVLMFRFVHVRPASRMCMPSMNVLLYPNNEELDYEIYKKHGRLRSARNDIPMLSLHWTVVHKIDQNSPLFGLSKEQMIKKKIEIIVIVGGIDEITSDNFQKWHSFTAEEIFWNFEFEPMTKCIVKTDKPWYYFLICCCFKIKKKYREVLEIDFDRLSLISPCST